MSSLFVTLVIIAVSILFTRWIFRIDKIVKLLERIVVLLEKDQGINTNKMCSVCGFIYNDDSLMKCPKCGFGLRKT